MTQAYDDSLEAFVRALPKAELHVHIEGTLEPELMFRLAERNRVPIRFGSVEAVRAAYGFSSLQAFLDIYYEGANVLRTARDFTDLATAYFERLAADGGVHAELFFDPQTHTARGVALAEVIQGLVAGMDEARVRLGVTSKLILCFLRHLDESAAFATLREAMPFLAHIDGVGLDSSELGHPPEKFARVFAAARQMGLKLVAHAGEEGPPAYVWQALDVLRVDRIDHGNRAMEDPALVKRLARDRMALTVCPLSNLELCVVDRLEDHPLRRMIDEGLVVTINSDDPAYFGGYLVDNYVRVARALGLSRGDLEQLASNSIAASFMPLDAKAAWLGQSKIIVHP